MSTKVKDRHESPIEYLEVAKKLLGHSYVYLPHLGDKTRTLIQVPLLGYARIILEKVVFLNRETEDLKERKKYIREALTYLDIYEIQLSQIQENETYKQRLSDFGWLMFGTYIMQERKLLKGLLKKMLSS